MTKLDSFWFDFLDLVFPRSCEACNKMLEHSECLLCSNCLIGLPRIYSNKPFQNEMNSKFARYPQVNGVYPFLLYRKQGVAQQLIKKVKYKNQQELGALLGRLFATELQSMQLLKSIDAIIPVPIHMKKLKVRGYNQSKVIAKGFEEVIGKPIKTDILLRDIHLSSQTTKSKLERFVSLQNSFILNPNVSLPLPSSVILIDDVLTTGATLEACIEPLVANGVTQLTIITIAAAP